MEYEAVRFADGSVAPALAVAECLVQLRTWAADLATAGIVFEALHDVLVGMKPVDAVEQPYQQVLRAAGYLVDAGTAGLVYAPLMVQVLQELQRQGDVYHRYRRRVFGGMTAEGLIALQLEGVGGRDG
jgi:hypothetical protein